MRITAPERPIDAIDCAKEELTDALSLTRERVRVWVSENLSLQKLNNAEKKDRHPLPPLSHRKMGEGTESVAFRYLNQGLNHLSRLSDQGEIREGEQAAVTFSAAC